MLKHKVSANTLVARAQQWARASEQPFLSLGTEFLCAAAWPLCTVVFAFGHASANNDIVLWQKLLGVGLYVAICSMLRAAAPGGHVAISGAFVVADLMFGTAHDPPPEGSGRPRTPGSRDYSPMLWARLLMQASGSLLVYGALRNLIPTYEHNLFYMWRNAAFVADSNSFIGVVCVQLAVGSIVGGLSLRNAQYIKKLGQHGAFRDTVRSGLFFVFFTFPWGGIGCSVVSTVWLARASGLSELAVPVSLLMFTVIQALLSKLLAELMHGDAA